MEVRSGALAEREAIWKTVASSDILYFHPKPATARRPTPVQWAVAPTTDFDRKLSDEELAWLGEMLARVFGGKIPSVEALDGFVTALAVCPDLIEPSEYTPIIVSGKTKDGDLVFDSLKEAERFHVLLIRHRTHIDREFVRGVWMPYLEEDNAGNIKGNEWAEGSLTGTHLRHDLFSSIANDEQRGGPFIPLWCLAYEHSEDPALRPYQEPITTQQREEIVVSMIAGVRKLHAMLRKNRKRGPKASFAPPSKVKVGRNDPCPCGSGKKFIGRETHKMMLDHYQQTKNVLVSFSPNAMGFFPEPSAYSDSGRG